MSLPLVFSQPDCAVCPYTATATKRKLLFRSDETDDRKKYKLLLLRSSFKWHSQVAMISWVLHLVVAAGKKHFQRKEDFFRTLYHSFDPPFPRGLKSSVLRAYSRCPRSIVFGTCFSLLNFVFKATCLLSFVKTLDIVTL